MNVFELKIVDEAAAEKVAKGGQPLLDLCLEEAESFSTFLHEYAVESKDRDASMYADGLADWEKKAIAGYLYQKTLGRV